MLIVAQDELFQRRRSLSSDGAPIPEALPARADRCIDGHQDKEGPALQFGEDRFIPDGGGDEVSLPVQGYVVEKSGDVVEVDHIVECRGGNGSIGGGLFDCWCRCGSSEGDFGEVVLLHEICRNGVFACAEA